MRFLQIGVFGGGSLWMWRRFFGPEATIIDIDLRCALHDGRDGQVRIGSQTAPEFLGRVADEMGGLDLVLDDGSHRSAHIRASLAALFPRLSDGGGLDMVEDLHAAYWPSSGGGYRAEGSFMTDLKAMVDNLHHWCHDRGQEAAPTRDALVGLHLHDSFAVLEKGPAQPPRHTVGNGPDVKGWPLKERPA